MLFGSRPPDNDAIWSLAKRAGFEITIHDRNASNKEKKIDIGIVAELTRDAYSNASKDDVFTIVLGDSDYVPAVINLIKDGFRVDIVFWSHASKELREVFTIYILG